MEYSIDTSAILDTRVRYYPPDVFPALWRHLEQLIDQGLLLATEIVLDELEKKADEVREWARKRPHMFIATDLKIQEIVRRILRTYPSLVDPEKTGPEADPFVIALAQRKACAVVTGERPGRNPAKRPHIPDVCGALGMRCLSVL